MPSSSVVDDALAAEFQWMISHLRLAAPRMLLASDARPPLPLFADAFFEVESADAGIGGVVIVDPRLYISRKG